MEMKGFVFTLDAIFAILIVMTVLINSYTFFIQPTKNILVLDRATTDILFVLDENGTIATHDNETIKNIIDGLIPKNTKYSYNITYFDVVGSNVIQETSFLYSNVMNDTDIVYDVRAVPVFSSEGGLPINLSQIARAKLGVSI